jgi:hypothetical protein
MASVARKDGWREDMMVKAEMEMEKCRVISEQ